MNILRYIWFIPLLALPLSAAAHTDDQLMTGAEIAASGVSCEEISNEQFEALGEYYMEQMHPGEAHEFMDLMMGGDGSASLRVAHISMGRSLYCGEDAQDNRGMMGITGMMGSAGMAGTEGMMGGSAGGMSGIWGGASAAQGTMMFAALVALAVLLAALAALIKYLRTPTKR